MVYRKYIFPFLWMAVLCLHGQDVQFSQYYATSLVMNPAFTGATKYARMTLAQRTQWPSSQGRVISYLTAYDRFFYYQKLGIGGVFQYDRLGSAAINNFKIGPSASYVIYNEKDKNLRLGLGLYFANKKYTTGSLVFGDQLDPDFGQIAAQSRDSYNGLSISRSYLDASMGFLYNTKHFWVGGAAHHINMPNTSIDKTQITTPFRLGLHTGYKINFLDKTGLVESREQNITLTANFKNQGIDNQLDLGAYVILEPITFGFWYRGLPMIRSKNGYINQDALVAMLGVDFMDFRAAYSYDLTISKLGLNTGGTHELSIVWEFGDISDPKKRKPGKMKTMYMPYPKM